MPKFKIGGHRDKKSKPVIGGHRGAPPAPTPVAAPAWKAGAARPGAVGGRMGGLLGGHRARPAPQESESFEEEKSEPAYNNFESFEEEKSEPAYNNFESFEEESSEPHYNNFDPFEDEKSEPHYNNFDPFESPLRSAHSYSVPQFGMYEEEKSDPTYYTYSSQPEQVYQQYVTSLEGLDPQIYRNLESLDSSSGNYVDPSEQKYVETIYNLDDDDDDDWDLSDDEDDDDDLVLSDEEDEDEDDAGLAPDDPNSLENKIARREARRAAGGSVDMAGADTKAMGDGYRGEQGRKLKDELETAIRNAVAALRTRKERLAAVARLDPGNPGALDAFRASLPVALGAKVASLNHAETVKFFSDLVDEQREFLRRQDIALDSDDNVDEAVLAQRTVQYDNTEESQQASTVKISGGRLMRDATHAAQPGGSVDTSESATFFSGNGYEIFVVGPDGDIHMGSHKVGKYHHSSLLEGTEVVMAGEMKVTGGKIVYMSNKSGHYTPTAEQFKFFLEALAAAGVDLDFEIKGWALPPGVTTAADWVGPRPNRPAPRIAYGGYS